MENISFKSARTVPVEFLCKVPSALDRVIQDATTDLALRVRWELEKGECVCSLSAPEQIQAVDLNQVEIRRTVNFQRLVRCGECEYTCREDDHEIWCTGRGSPCQLVAPDGFCDKGKRRTENEAYDHI